MPSENSAIPFEAAPLVYFARNYYRGRLVRIPGYSMKCSFEFKVLDVWQQAGLSGKWPEYASHKRGQGMKGMRRWSGLVSMKYIHTMTLGETSGTIHSLSMTGVST